MAKNSTRVKGKSSGATKTAPSGVTKARYILVAGKPFSCYTGTTTFTDLCIVARTDDSRRMAALMNKHFDDAAGLLLWIDTETGRSL